MRAFSLVLLLGAVGCASSAPPVVERPAPPAPRPSPVVVAPPTPEPELDEVEVEIVEEPEVVPGAEREQVVRRSVFETARVAEWELASGLRVVYAWDADADGYMASMTAPGGWRSLPAGAAPVATRGRWGDVDAEVGPEARIASVRSDRLDDVLDGIAAVFREDPDVGGRALALAFDRPEAFTLVLHGSMGWEWAERAVGARLGVLAGRRPLIDRTTRERRDQARVEGDPESSLRAEIPVTWTDFPTVVVLIEALTARAGRPLSLAVEPGGRLALHAPDARTLREWLAPLSDADLREARSRSARDVAAPEGLVVALGALYALPGDFRPVRPPAEARALTDRVQRMPPDRVEALRQRLAAAPVTSLVLTHD